MRIAIVTAALLVAATQPARAEIYRYLDAEGREQFTTHLEDVPVAQREASAARDGGTLNFGGGAGAKPAPQTHEVYESDALERVPAPAAPDLSAAAPTAGGHDEMWWRSSSISHSEAVERAEAGIERCEAADDRRRDASGLTPLGVCDAAKAKLESAEEALDRFEEQARHAEVPAGWLR